MKASEFKKDQSIIEIVYLSLNFNVSSSARFARSSAEARSLAVSSIILRASRISTSYISLTFSVCEPHLPLDKDTKFFEENNRIQFTVDVRVRVEVFYFVLPNIEHVQYTMQNDH